MLIDTLDDGPVNEIDMDPRMINLLIRQHKAHSRFTANQAQEYLRLSLVIGKEIKAREHRQDR